MTDIQIRLLGVAGFIAASFILFAVSTGAPLMAADGDATGAKPRTAKTCIADDCAVPPERVKAGFGNGGSHAQTPAAGRDMDARWGR